MFEAAEKQQLILREWLRFKATIGNSVPWGNTGKVYSWSHSPPPQLSKFTP